MKKNRLSVLFLSISSYGHALVLDFLGEGVGEEGGGGGMEEGTLKTPIP
jgi:hypothetical protein